jgi:hypothetical protein
MLLTFYRELEEVMNVIFKNHSKHIAITLFLMAVPLLPLTSTAATNEVVFVKQGTQWSNTDRESFYSQDQGSQLMPLKWFQALKQSNGKLFLADSLSRYGYLPNETSPTPGLPVGFTINKDYVGMTCAACHTRQISVDNTYYRIDGGPAIVDFQSFATDLGDAVNGILKDSNKFEEFSRIVLGGSVTSEQQSQLHKEVEAWNLPFRTIMDNALPKENPWGPARLDAVGMIFNRLTGLDIGLTPDHIITKNIHLADSPVRYPFIWNAPIQDKTQWPGFADNGNDILGLARNLGEVIGVFAHFYPQKDDWRVLGIDYLQNNSANFHGLRSLEKLVKKIGPPKWPWKQGSLAVNQNLADQGKIIYESKTKTEDGGCAGCHGIRKGATRSLHETWATPLCYVDTDTRQFNLLNWKVETGVLAGAEIPFLHKPLQAENEDAINVLGLAVIGSILQRDSPVAMGLESIAKKEAVKIEKLVGVEKTQKLHEKAVQLRQMQGKLVNKDNAYLKGAFQSLAEGWQKSANKKSRCKEDFKAKEPALAYESRVLEGIWATAPYLHNGSISTLADLLKPVANRRAAFKVGSNYDPVNVGLATEQSQFNFTLHTTDCSKQDSGNSRCGHEFGAKLTDAEKKSLLEYLKTL